MGTPRAGGASSATGYRIYGISVAGFSLAAWAGIGAMQRTLRRRVMKENHVGESGAVRPRVLHRALAAVVAVSTLILLTTIIEASPAAAATCSDSLQAKIDAAPPGGTVTAEGCIYRERIEIDKPISIVGESGAEIRGSDVWSGWKKRKDRRWVSTRT